MSVRCPACTRPMEFKDLTLRSRLEGDVSTMGHVELDNPSEMIGRLICGRFTNTGRFDGQAVVYGQIVLSTGSFTTGQITGKCLDIQPGATARIKANIRPKPVLGPAQGRVPERPAKKLIPRIAAVNHKGFRPIV